MVEDRTAMMTAAVEEARSAGADCLVIGRALTGSTNIEKTLGQFGLVQS